MAVVPGTSHPPWLCRVTPARALPVLVECIANHQMTALGWSSKIPQEFLSGWANSSQSNWGPPRAKDKHKILSLRQATALKYQLWISSMMIELAKFANFRVVPCSGTPNLVYFVSCLLTAMAPKQREQQSIALVLGGCWYSFPSMKSVVQKKKALVLHTCRMQGGS